MDAILAALSILEGFLFLAWVVTLVNLKKGGYDKTERKKEKRAYLNFFASWIVVLIVVVVWVIIKKVLKLF